jgi:hypothetical protein
MAQDDFERARSKAFWRRVTTIISGKSNQLLPFEARTHLGQIRHGALVRTSIPGQGVLHREISKG